MDSSSHPKNFRAADYFHFLLYALLFIGFIYIFIISTNPSQSEIFPTHTPPCDLPSMANKRLYTMAIYRDKLDEALGRASREDKTVIIAVVNRAYVEGDKPMLDLFLDGFWVGEGTRELVRHVLVAAVDQTSYERCVFLRLLHCYRLETDGVDFAGEEVYMSEDFIKMMWRRTQFLRDVLKLGYSFIFTDSDVLWLRDPFPKLMSSHNETLDLQISTDDFNGDDRSESNPINTGFYMIRSNNRTIALFDSWYDMRNSSAGLKEQDVLNKLIRHGWIEKLGLNVRFLDTKFFSGFCQDSTDVRSVVTVHANCCRTISAKLADLTAVIHDWRRFKSLSGEDVDNRTAAFRWSHHVNCAESWRTP
ncbi:unnamed protein product [Cuscuta campestris]|uniref:Glycosyltransferase n=1 Tax=Cuscuta campestris TaxID=132261 RepID=A0A484LNJ7_9ASTE|nr:unnamed protein product [Cuscuta campestris]